MAVRRPPDPETNEVRTFYRRPLLDRPTGRYTVAWPHGGGVASIRVRNRLRDLEGHRPPLGSLRHLPRTVATYLEARRRPILARPLPFLVFEAIAYLETLVGPGARVVELGGGNSTLWFLTRGATVACVEHDPAWADAIRREAEARLGPEGAARLTVTVAEGDAALRAAGALEDRSFDLALVDCMNAHTPRRDGVIALAPKVRPGGTLCLDNSDHPNNWSAVTLLGRSRRLRFTGLAPMCSVISQTSFWTIPGPS